MNHITTVLAIFVAALSLAGCQRHHPDEQWGRMIGYKALYIRTFEYVAWHNGFLVDGEIPSEKIPQLHEMVAAMSRNGALRRHLTCGPKGSLLW